MIHQNVLIAEYKILLVSESDEFRGHHLKKKKKHHPMSPKCKRVVEAMKNMAFIYPKHLQVFVCVQNWVFLCVHGYVCVCVCMCVCVSECEQVLCTRAGHQRAVNFRPSRGTATKSITDVMNVLLGTGISV